MYVCYCQYVHHRVVVPYVLTDSETDAKARLERPGGKVYCVLNLSLSTTGVYIHVSIRWFSLE